MVQWFRLCASTAGGIGLIPGRGTRLHMLYNAAKKKLFFFKLLMVLETEKSKIKALTNSVFGEGPLPSSKKAAFSLSPHMAERGGSSLESLL